MKSFLLSLIGISLLLSLFIQTTNAQIITIQVGLVSNGQPFVSDQNLAIRALKSNLPATAILSEVDIIYAQSDRQYYLRGKVANDRILSIAIRLTEKETGLSLSSGPGIEILCYGTDECVECISKSKEGHDVCKCASNRPGSNGYCESVVSTTILL